ncbi:MAG: hypothetical protein HY735_29360 [Verrucomicrobia bacterium]|nr:hypothetical protein [Verrucomicrobiota bacterium]
MKLPPPQIETDTPIVPRAVAEAVWDEASVWLGEPLPRRWRRELIEQANTVYASNARFRRTLRRNGDAGRDWLWAFMRHWLSALIRRHRPQVHPLLPQAYNLGHPLPSKPTAREKTGQRRPVI